MECEYEGGNGGVRSSSTNLFCERWEKVGSGSKERENGGRGGKDLLRENGIIPPTARGGLMGRVRYAQFVSTGVIIMKTYGM